MSNARNHSTNEGATVAVAPNPLTAVYDRLLTQCGEAAPLPVLRNRLPIDRDVIGLICDRARAVAALSQFTEADLERAGVLGRNGSRAPAYAAELFEDGFVGVVIRDSAGKPVAVLTDRGGLAPGAAPDRLGRRGTGDATRPAAAWLLAGGRHCGRVARLSRFGFSRDAGRRSRSARLLAPSRD